MAPARSEFAKRFGANLARARREAGVSQEELSHRASLHRTAVGQLERGERVARAETLFKLACALSVPVGCFSRAWPGRRRPLPWAGSNSWIRGPSEAEKHLRKRQTRGVRLGIRL